MPKIIVTSRYIKYIATREGVEKPTQNRELDRGIFMNYLDSRPNSHGLFYETDDPLVLDKVAKEVANHPGAIWTHIVSLKREDAERTGYVNWIQFTFWNMLKESQARLRDSLML